MPDRGVLCSRSNGVLSSTGGECTLLCIDVDDFTSINTQFGRKAGDLLLAVIGRRLNAALHDADVAAHLGADHFAALLDDDMDVRDAIDVATRIQESIAEPIELGGRIIWLHTTVGLINGAHGPGDAAEMIRRAEAAAHEGKVSGQHTLIVVGPALGSPPAENPRHSGRLTEVPASVSVE